MTSRIVLTVQVPWGLSFLLYWVARLLMFDGGRAVAHSCVTSCAESGGGPLKRGRGRYGATVQRRERAAAPTLARKRGSRLIQELK